jgi:tetratricopeptide (TPR) repeat protein
MRRVIIAAGLAVSLAAGAASANPLDDAKAGVRALDNGLNSMAVRLFTSAINSHRLLRADQELAYVKRAQAHIALGEGQLALADAYTAMSLDPRDNEAIVTRDRAQALLNPPVAQARAAAPAPETPAYEKSQAAYQEALKRYEEEKSSDAKRYDEQLSRYDAQLKTEQARRDRNCRAGDLSQCKAEAQAAQPAATPPPGQAAKPTPKPVAKPITKSTTKVTAAPDERPRFF